MHIIQRIGKKQSRKVMPEDMARVRSLVPEIHKLCLEPLGTFTNGAYAIAHCQVDQDDPLRFFVLNDGTCVINPRITYIGKPFRHTEGCMSACDVQALLGVQRYHSVDADFIGLSSHDSPEENQEGLRIEGLLALVFQHEVDHMNGKHIFQ